MFSEQYVGVSLSLLVLTPTAMTRTLLVLFAALCLLGSAWARGPKFDGPVVGECPADVFAKACTDLGGCVGPQEIRLRSLAAKYDDIYNPANGANFPVFVATGVNKTAAQLPAFTAALNTACPPLTAADVAPWLSASDKAALSVWGLASGQYSVIAGYVDASGAAPVSTESFSPALSGRGALGAAPNPVRTCLEGRCQYTIAGAGRRVPLLGDRTLCEGDNGDNFEQVLETAGQSLCLDLIQDSYEYKKYLNTIASCRNNGDFVCTYTFKGTGYANVRDPTLVA